MSLEKIENAIGEIEPFPVPVDYEAPLPITIGSRDEARALLGIVGLVGGDVDFAFSVYNSIGLPLLIAEVGIVKELRQRPYGRLGVPYLTRRRMDELYPDTDDVGLILVQDAFGPFQLTGYFSWLHDVLSGQKAERVIIPNKEVIILEDEARPGLDIMSFRRFITPYNFDNSQIEPDQLLAGSGIELDRAIELSADLRDGFFNYLARLTTSSAALIGLQSRRYYNYNTMSTEHLNMSHLIRPEIGRILNSSQSRLEQMAQIRKLFPAIIMTAKRLAKETGPLDYDSEYYYVQLVSMLERVEDLEAVQRIAGVQPLKDSYGKAEEDKPVIIVEPGGGKSTSGPNESAPATNEQNLAAADQVRQVALEADEEWQMSGSVAKKIPGHAELSHLLLTGESDYDIDIAGITKDQVKNVAAVLGIIQTKASAGQSNQELDTIIGDFTNRYRGLGAEYKRIVDELDLKSRSLVLPFPESGFISGLDYIRNNQATMIKAIKFCYFGEVTKLIELISTLSSMQPEPV